MGCAFAGRCLSATELCRTVAPAVEEKRPGHFGGVPLRGICDGDGGVKDRQDDCVPLYLRLLDAKLDRALDKIDNLATRSSIVETGLANVRSEIAGLHHAYAAIQLEMDQANKRLARIERRLDMQEVRA